MGPEVYLKSLSMARNIAVQRGEEIRHFTTANFDLIEFSDFREEGSPTDAHYYHRPKKTILVRTVKDGGEKLPISPEILIVPFRSYILSSQSLWTRPFSLCGRYTLLRITDDLIPSFWKC